MLDILYAENSLNVRRDRLIGQVSRNHVRYCITVSTGYSPEYASGKVSDTITQKPISSTKVTNKPQRSVISLETTCPP